MKAESAPGLGSSVLGAQRLVRLLERAPLAAYGAWELAHAGLGVEAAHAGLGPSRHVPAALGLLVLLLVILLQLGHWLLLQVRMH